MFKRPEFLKSLQLETLEARYVLSCASVAACVRFEFVDPASPGTPLSSLTVGEPFELRAYIQDVRPEPAGFSLAYLDVNYDSALAAVTGDVEREESLFDLLPRGDVSMPGLIDSAGGNFRGIPDPPDEDFFPV